MKKFSAGVRIYRTWKLGKTGYFCWLTNRI